MFGGPLSCPKKEKPPTWPKGLVDLNMPGVHAYHYAHKGRTPNTNYEVRYLHYKQRLKETLDKMTNLFTRNALGDKLFIQYFTHYEKKDLQIEIRRRAEAKLRAADEAIEKRREKLLEMLSIEERQFYFESVDQAQRGKKVK
ncbi:hypothetical protein WA026_017501 [Henosepilachna vigintioctopunctata]|uniref:Uncharacterized protein n=1 Tax=Henosepilachna vigintioctopunctata TaxID=420089 RepID=A0AAW1USW9_9CUCU